MNLRLLASGAAIAVAGVIGYGIYQLVPLGKPLARSEIIGELNGPALASSSRVALQRYGERQLLIGQRLVSAKDMPALEKAPLLDAQVPALGTRQQNPWLQTDTRNLIYGGQGTGIFDLLGSISGDAGVSLIGTPQGRELYLITAIERTAAKGEQPAAFETLRSDDLGKTWARDVDVVLGPGQQHTVFLTQDRVIAMEPMMRATACWSARTGRASGRGSRWMNRCGRMGPPLNAPFATCWPRTAAPAPKTNWPMTGRCIRWMSGAP